jgi:hypothetical protein
MLDIDFLEQPRLKEQIQNNLKERMHEIVLGEGHFIQNKLGVYNFPSVSRAKPFFVLLDYIYHREYK